MEDRVWPRKFTTTTPQLRNHFLPAITSALTALGHRFSRRLSTRCLPWSDVIATTPTWEIAMDQGSTPSARAWLGKSLIIWRDQVLPVWNWSDGDNTDVKVNEWRRSVSSSSEYEVGSCLGEECVGAWKQGWLSFEATLTHRGIEMRFWEPFWSHDSCSHRVYYFNKTTRDLTLQGWLPPQH